MDPYAMPHAPFKLWAFLQAHAHEDRTCPYSFSYLSRRCSLHRNSVRSSLKKLAEWEFISLENGIITVHVGTTIVQKGTVEEILPITGTEDAKSSTAVHCSSVVHCSTPVFKTTAKASTPLPPTGGCMFDQKINSFPQARPSRRRHTVDPFASIPADATYEPPTSEQSSEAKRLLDLWNTTFPATVRRSCNQILDQIALVRLLKQDYTSQQVESVIRYLRKETRIRFWPRPANLLHQTRQGMVAIDKILMDIDLDPKISDWDRLSEQEKRDKFYLGFGPEHFKHFSPEEKQCVLDARARKAAREGKEVAV